MVETNIQLPWKAIVTVDARNRAVPTILRLRTAIDMALCGGIGKRGNTIVIGESRPLMRALLSALG